MNWPGVWATTARKPRLRFVEFTAQTRMSGVDLPDGTRIRKGASDAIEQYAKTQGRTIPADLHTQVEKSLFPRRHPPGGLPDTARF